MPPKVQHTREQIISAAFELIRKEGADNLNARTVAGKLGCSTQPVMYHFKTVDELRREVYRQADKYHSDYIMLIHSGNPLLDIGLNYVRFAVEEGHLFRFLFQSDSFSGKSLVELLDDDALLPLLNILMEKTGVGIDDARNIFRAICMVAHGYACMLANNMMNIDEDTIKSDLYMTFTGYFEAVKKRKGDKK